jgi:DNA-binding winged helix-turn-helix (wHTH) protein
LASNSHNPTVIAESLKWPKIERSGENRYPFRRPTVSGFRQPQSGTVLRPSSHRLRVIGAPLWRKSPVEGGSTVPFGDAGGLGTLEADFLSLRFMHQHWYLGAAVQNHGSRRDVRPFCNLPGWSEVAALPPTLHAKMVISIHLGSVRAVMKGTNDIYEFGPFRLEVKERRLLRDGQQVQLRAKVFDTLRVLIENHGKLVGKDELMKAVWPDAVVEEGNLALNLTVLRKALGDNATGKQHVETVPGRGYRFIANVRVVENGEDAAPARLAAPEHAAGSWEQRLEAARAALASNFTVTTAMRGVSGH